MRRTVPTVVTVDDGFMFCFTMRAHEQKPATSRICWRLRRQRCKASRTTVRSGSKDWRWRESARHGAYQSQQYASTHPFHRRCISKWLQGADVRGRHQALCPARVLDLFTSEPAQGAIVVPDLEYSSKLRLLCFLIWLLILWK
jgi:hypothetical protein